MHNDNDGDWQPPRLMPASDPTTTQRIKAIPWREHRESDTWRPDTGGFPPVQADGPDETPPPVPPQRERTDAERRLRSLAVFDMQGTLLRSTNGHHGDTELAGAVARALTDTLNDVVDDLALGSIESVSVAGTEQALFAKRRGDRLVVGQSAVVKNPEVEFSELCRLLDR